MAKQYGSDNSVPPLSPPSPLQNLKKGTWQNGTDLTTVQSQMAKRCRSNNRLQVVQALLRHRWRRACRAQSAAPARPNALRGLGSWKPASTRRCRPAASNAQSLSNSARKQLSEKPKRKRQRSKRQRSSCCTLMRARESIYIYKIHFIYLRR